MGKHRLASLAFALVLVASVGSDLAWAQGEPTAADTPTPTAPEPVAPQAGGEGGAAGEETGAAAGASEQLGGWQASLDEAFGTYVISPLVAVMFYDVWFWDNPDLDSIEDPEAKAKADANDTKLPLLVIWLVVGAVFFTLRMGFVNLRGFGHAVKVTRGVYDNPDDAGEVSHFQALVAALSATVGLGNIAGVAIAISQGGPGATFWMIVAGFLGMSSKFVECTLGQKYREVRPDGRIMGGAMFYLSKGLTGKGLPGVGRTLAMVFAILCIGASFAGGNAFQVNQSMQALSQTVPWFGENGWAYGVIMMGAVGVVIIGGIKRIAETAEKIVPLMCAIYVAACLYILFTNIDQIPAAFAAIFAGAFSPEAARGGAIGVLIIGFKRAAFSNEAGIGSAAIAHAAARTEYPVREGMVALLEPFVDTIVICTMTALVIVITGAYINPDYASLVASDQGAAVTSLAMGEVISWFPYVLTVAVVLFAYSTMISWSYYGERCWSYIFGDSSSMVYRVIYIGFVFLGAVISATNVLVFGDLMILGMALPNLVGLYWLAGEVARDKNEYLAHLRAGHFKTYK